MSNIAFLFDGQGTQYVGMCRELYNEKRTIKDVFDRANEILGYSLQDICFNGPEEQLNNTKYSQPAIYTASIALYQYFVNKYNITGTVAAGHSLGEYSALTAAGALTFEDGLKLVQQRGILMADVASKRKSGMLVVIGLNIDEIKEMITKYDDIFISNHNSYKQVVISGDLDKLQLLEENEKRKEIKFIPLKVSGAFHSPFMKEAADKLQSYMNDIEFKECNFPVLSNMDVSAYVDKLDIKNKLIKQITEPVRWYETIIKISDYEIDMYIEFGTSLVLKNLMKDINYKEFSKTFSIYHEETPINLKMLSHRSSNGIEKIRECYTMLVTTPNILCLNEKEYEDNILKPSNIVKKAFYDTLNGQVSMSEEQIDEIMNITQRILACKGTL